MNLKKNRFYPKHRRSALAATFAVLLCWLVATTAFAGDHNEERHAENYESKFYGTVEKLPQDLIGIWIVNGREIIVGKETRIKDKHGQPELGAFVEVEGSNTGIIFTASEVKVKRAKQY